MPENFHASDQAEKCLESVDSLLFLPPTLGSFKCSYFTLSLGVQHARARKEQHTYLSRDTLPACCRRYDRTGRRRVFPDLTSSCLGIFRNHDVPCFSETCRGPSCPRGLLRWREVGGLRACRQPRAPSRGSLLSAGKATTDGSEVIGERVLSVVHEHDEGMMLWVLCCSTLFLSFSITRTSHWSLTEHAVCRFTSPWGAKLFGECATQFFRPCDASTVSQLPWPHSPMLLACVVVRPQLAVAAVAAGAEVAAAAGEEAGGTLRGLVTLGAEVGDTLKGEVHRTEPPREAVRMETGTSGAGVPAMGRAVGSGGVHRARAG